MYNGATLVAENDNWDSGLAPVFDEVGAFGWTAGSKDAAVLLELGPGGYTVTVENGDNSGREAVVEVYDVSKNNDTKFVNLSCRTKLNSNDPVIVGLTLDKTAAVLLRNGGPSLAALGVTGAALDTTLVIFEGTSPIVENDDWEQSLATLFLELGAYGYGSSTKDAALKLETPPNQITVHAKSKGSPGVGIIELYLIDK
ncbi:MAG: hypothetical protein SFV32_06510 [Opitutaceae bacterium]|nr:hypothetical protein [Opitutaceae bacterium]